MLFNFTKTYFLRPSPQADCGSLHDSSVEVNLFSDTIFLQTDLSTGPIIWTKSTGCLYSTLSAPDRSKLSAGQNTIGDFPNKTDCLFSMT